jgi:hypothetical protein
MDPKPVHKSPTALQHEIAAASKLSDSQKLEARQDWVDRYVRNGGEVAATYSRYSSEERERI